MVSMRNPEAKATARQLWRLHELTGEDTRDWVMTRQEASDKISKYEDVTYEKPPEDVTTAPFEAAHITLIEGDMGSGKSVTAVGMVIDDYYNDCVRIYCRDILKRTVKVLAYSRDKLIAKIEHKNKTLFIRIPKDYKLTSPKRIFANFHLYGIPYVYVPSFGKLLHWLRVGLICNGWLLIDESYLGMHKRDSITAFGKELHKESFQMRKLQLEVVLITPLASLIDKYARLTPTKHIMCSYNGKTKEVTLTIKEKGVRGAREVTYDAKQYWRNYKTNERIRQ